MGFGKWKRFTAADRITLSLVLLSTTSLSIADLFGILPNPRQVELRRKTDLCEALAINCSLLVQRGDESAITDNLRAVAERNSDVKSACVRRSDGTVIGLIGDHQKFWHLKSGDRSLPHNIFVPIASRGVTWGAVELSFTRHDNWHELVAEYPLLALGIATVVLNGILYRWYMGRMLAYLDPSKAVPAHVRSTLDTFAEGVVVLDSDMRIVLANDAFCRAVGMSPEEIQGARIDSFGWKHAEAAINPWEAIRKGNTRLNTQLTLEQTPGEPQIFLVSASAITGGERSRRGTIVSFDDITGMEQKRLQLNSTLCELQESRDELSRRNEELQFLATRDPLTSCINRRTFFETFENQWSTSQRFHHPLSCVMVDIDHFKSINDNYGHSMGDEVLREVSRALRESSRQADVVCRYGGEEFCVLMPHLNIEQAQQAAERLRLIVEGLKFEIPSVTASLGVSSIECGPESPQELLDQADKCLYVAKRNGRNQVVRWDQVPRDQQEGEATPIPRTEPNHGTTEKTTAGEVNLDRADLAGSIPYPAVASLLSALAYRDADTASHSMRVAELAVATARGRMSVKEAYVLEIAALLHDIGKIGVPDSILLKPGPLTSEEWQEMQKHDRIGVEIVATSFPHPELIDIVRFHHVPFQGRGDAPQVPKGTNIPLGARIVSIADSYDAIVSNRVYRKGRSQEEAFAELRRCAGTQFDPELVEQFIETVTNHRNLSLPHASKQSALQIGLQVQRLAEAVDDQDIARVKALASRLKETATSWGITQIQTRAAMICDASNDDEDMDSIAESLGELLDLCRNTQHAYVDVDSSVAAHPLPTNIDAADKTLILT